LLFDAVSLDAIQLGRATDAYFGRTESHARDTCE